MICPSCDEEAPQNFLPPALLARARRIEASMPGQRAAEEDWQVFGGAAGGALPWATTLRLMTCMEKAARSGRANLVCR